MNRTFSLAVLAFSATFVPVACGGGGAGGAAFPGKPDVVAAQAAWCESMAKLQGSPDKWEHMSDCKGADSSASAAYLRAMTACFKTRVEAAGDAPPDNSQIVVECNEEVAQQLPLDQGMGKEVLDARCARMLRCEKVADEDCRAGIDKLESAQRALFTTTYNPPALHEVADCLESKGCTDDEEAARDACYKPEADKLLWFPG
jgi:hypothetical protein